MIHFNVSLRPYNNYNDYSFDYEQSVAAQENQQLSLKGKEVITTWKYDEEGNIVYYTYDKKTGEILTKTKHKNPYKNFMQNNKI